MNINILNENAIIHNPYTRTVIAKTCTLHKHTFFEFTVCVSGKYVNYINGQTHDIAKGSVMLLRPQDVHYFVSESPHTHRDIYIPVSTLKTLCDCIDPHLFDELYNNPLTVNFHLRSYSLQIIEAKLNILSKFSDTVLLYKKSTYINVITEILNLWQESTHEQTLNYPKWIVSLIQKLNSESFLLQPIEEIINSVHYSHGYVCRQFKKFTGKTLSEFVSGLKFEYSLALLSDLTISVSQIAEKLNYSSASNYIIAFKHKYGITPAQWRNVNVPKSQ